MPYSSTYQDWPVPEDGEDVPADGVNGPIDLISESENWGDVLQTVLHHISLQSIKFGDKASRPATPSIPDGKYVWYMAVDETPMGIYVYDNSNGWRTVWDGDAYTLDGLDSSDFLQADGSIPATGSLDFGTSGNDTITETTSPKSFNFSGDAGRDTHIQTDVTISNSSTASATEDITVELYDGSDTTGTLLVSETQSVTVASGGTSTTTLIAIEKKLDSGTYHLEITQSGTTLAIDQTDEVTEGSVFSFSETSTGDFALRDEGGADRLTVDQITGGVTASFDQFTESVAAGIPATPAILASTATADTAIALQVGDDSVAAGTAGYSTGIRYYTESGEQLASLSADTVHNHWGVYTKSDAVGSGDTQNTKRLNVGGGSDVVDVEWMKVGQLKFGTGGAAGNEARMIIEPTAGNDSYIRFKDGSSTNTYAIISSTSGMTIHNYYSGTSPVTFPATGGTEFDEPTRLIGETELHFGGSQYSLRYDSLDDTLKFSSAENGAVAELDSVGNLTIEGTLTQGGTVGE